MKRNIFAVCALLVAVVLSSFTVQKFATVYFVYQLDSTTGEKVKTNYTYQTTSPGDKAGTQYVAWFIGTAVTPSAPTDAEFNTAFEAIDGDYGGTDNDLLSDETNENTANFEKRNPLN